MKPVSSPVHKEGDAAERGLLLPATPSTQRIIVAPPLRPHNRIREPLKISPQAQNYGVPLQAGVMSGDPAPVINVTIGRIEIRAVQIPAKPTPSREVRGPKPMGLDEYLKQRGGGR